MNPDATSAPSTLRDLARTRFAALCDQLTPSPRDVNASVHNARRELKKLRALLRLIRPSLGESLYEPNNAALRDAGRLLSPLRDAWVRLSLTGHFLDQSGTGHLRRALTVASDHLRADYDTVLRTYPSGRVFPEALALLRPAAVLLEEGPFPGGDLFETCQVTLRKTYREGRNGLRRALTSPTEVHLHEWRKRCKDLRYQLDFLHVTGPKIFRSLSGSLHNLTDALGQHHDLAVLRQTLEPHLASTLNPRQLLAFHRAFEQQHRSALDASLPLGCRIFGSPPKAFAARHAEKWKKAAPLLATAPR